MVYYVTLASPAHICLNRHASHPVQLGTGEMLPPQSVCLATLAVNCAPLRMGARHAKLARTCLDRHAWHPAQTDIFRMRQRQHVGCVIRTVPLALEALQVFVPRATQTTTCLIRLVHHFARMVIFLTP